jgi:hypothetical protein
VAIDKGYSRFDFNRGDLQAGWLFWQASRSALEPMLAELSEGQHLLKVIRIAEEYGNTMSLLFHQEDGQLSVAADCSDCFCWGSPTQRKSLLKMWSFTGRLLKNGKSLFALRSGANAGGTG